MLGFSRRLLFSPPSLSSSSSPSSSPSLSLTPSSSLPFAPSSSSSQASELSLACVRERAHSACPTRHWCFLRRADLRRNAAATSSSTGDENLQIDLLEEALDELLRLTPPGDIVVRVIGIRRVSDRWLLDATIRWSGSAPEDTSSVSFEIGVGLRVSSVGRPHDGGRRQRE